MSKHPGTTPPPLEQSIMELQTLHNVLEQINRHPEPMVKVSLRIHRMVKNIVEHELVVLAGSPPSNVPMAPNETTIF
jgi:fructose-1-phosphate kinase PfkB-like protein